MTSFAISQRLTRSLIALSGPLRRRRTYAQLKDLDTHLLRDIGLTPIDVDAMRRMW